MDTGGRNIKMIDFVQELKASGVPNTNIVSFLKSISLDDLLITRIISKT